MLKNNFLRGAAAIFGVFLVLSLLGFRQYVNVLSGTGAIEASHLFFGLAYLLSYIAAVILAPILLLAALFSSAMRMLSRRMRQ
ncbi:hypothetical protein U14_05409 [Candidatus Moduliflexus flocculans]|uniref:Uncharacterized protein n=1 Tax=Candidatus Moduliflexus flocculans TaxID=1499966 RepID=A0A081BRV0_9BACT|nr:hypothetical protein U14_05409 [Candidatus Moduliflexus flocculans]